MTVRKIAGLVLVFVGVGVVYRYIRRLNDPLDYLSLSVRYQPRFSVLYFSGMDAYDPVSYRDALHSIREFSRIYQTSFLTEIDPLEVMKRLAVQRRLMHRHVHVLRTYLPNDVHLERRLILGLEQTDGGMAHAMDDVAQRFPEARLWYSAGVRQTVVRAAEDVWN